MSEDSEIADAERVNSALARRLYGESGVFSAAFRPLVNGTWRYELIRADRHGVDEVAVHTAATPLAAVVGCNRLLMDDLIEAIRQMEARR